MTTREDSITPAVGQPQRRSEQATLPIAVPMPRFDANRIESRWVEMPAETVGDAIVAAAAAFGIERWWFVSGTEIAFLQEAVTKAEALGRRAPRLVTQVHEQVALAAALGDAMITRRPSAVAAHVDVGLFHMGGSITNAWRGEYPVLMLTGYPGTSYPGLLPGGRSNPIFWVQQQWDQGAIVRQYVKWDHKLAPYDNPGLIVGRALQLAMTEPRGPVYLAVPGELPLLPLDGPLRFPGPDLLGPPARTAPDPAALRQAACWLLEAAQPVIVTERVGRDPEAVAPLVALAEALGANVQASPSRMSFPDDHPLKGPVADLHDADIVLSVDSVVPWMPGPKAPGVEARVIVFDTDPAYSRIPLHEFPADLRIAADPALGLSLLLDEVRRVQSPAQRRAAEERADRLAATHRAARERALEQVRRSASSGRITPDYLTDCLGRVAGTDDIVVGTAVSSPAPGLCRRTRPGTAFFGSHGSGLGWALGAALGIKTARPDRTVVYFGGDGDYMFGVPQAVLWASLHAKAPIVAVIQNNRGYSTGTTNVQERYPDGYSAGTGNFQGGWFDPPPNFAGEATANGCFGERVTTPEELEPALRRAFNTVQHDGVPAVVDVWLPKLITGE